MDAKEIQNSNEDPTQTVENVAEEVPIEDKKNTVTNEIPSNSGMIQTSTGLVDPNKPYHIIGGAFTERSNADRYQSKLITGGNSSVIIGQFDKLYIVSISSFSSLEEAQNAMSNSKAISSNAWIFKWP
jgi:cell division protein FtsN